MGFIPTICACVKYRLFFFNGRLQGLTLFSTKKSELIGQSRCCLHRGVCTIGYFKLYVGVFLICWRKHEYVLVPHSDGGTEVKDFNPPSHPHYLLFSTSSSLFSLAGMQMKGLLQDDGAPLWQLSRPHIWPAAVAVFPSWLHCFSCQLISGSVSRSADVFLVTAMIDSRRVSD